jgi:alpha-galactosidase
MAITFDKSTKTFYLDGKSVTYAFYVNNHGYLEHLYFGKRIGHDLLLYTRKAETGTGEAALPGVYKISGICTYNQMGTELSFSGTGDFRESCVHVKNPEGDRLSQLLYYSYEILEEKPKMKGMPSLRGGETLVVHLYDEITSFRADLYYTVYDDCDVVARRIVYKNCAEKAVTLDRAYSFAMTIPEGEYDMLTLYGGWSHERQQERTPVRRGISRIDSKRGSSSAAENPFMAIMTPETTEADGEAFGFNLIYSSSYALTVDRVP